MAYTYILKCSDGSFYTGWTINLENRLAEHNKGTGSKYTRARLPVELVYYEWQENQSTAQKREASIKRLSREEKSCLINGFKMKHRKIR